ncbi:hypothetical protein CLSAB_19280 [Clostridium saccharobutylicum]|uniref:hypothetical protein n=1 Tax=Clostridium saccharobutylicum TaxID=169679 RepID=UPI00098C770F|nr:hypothetical protein [Clostridium saccharobutylicum]OOM17208.1 hypothetical protein CLSAB_19280 [Clostridium saccharobutylicum]
MDNVICDKCKKEIKFEIFTKYKNKRIEIQFLRCNHCGHKALISITDRKTREKQREYNKMFTNENKVLMALQNSNSKQANKLLEGMAKEKERLQEEIKVAYAELREKYKGEL